MKASSATTAGRLTVIDTSAHGVSARRCTHSREDEWFYVIAGELTLWVGGRTISARAGSFVYGPRGIPHTFVVASERARFLLVTEPGGLDEFMRALSVPATSVDLL